MSLPLCLDYRHRLESSHQPGALVHGWNLYLHMKIRRDNEGGTGLGEKWRRALRFWEDFLLARHRCLAAGLLYLAVLVCAVCCGLFMIYALKKVVGGAGRAGPGRSILRGGWEDGARRVLGRGTIAWMHAQGKREVKYFYYNGNPRLGAFPSSI